MLHRPQISRRLEYLEDLCYTSPKYQGDWRLEYPGDSCYIGPENPGDSNNQEIRATQASEDPEDAEGPPRAPPKGR